MPILKWAQGIKGPSKIGFSGLLDTFSTAAFRNKLIYIIVLGIVKG